MKLKFLFISLLFAQLTFAVEAQKETHSEIKAQINELGVLSASDFSSKVDGYRAKIGKYIENKKRVCNGEFTTLVLRGDKEQNVTAKRKLSRQEKYMCFEEVKNLQILYINKMYLSRKRYLDYLHEARVQKLGTIKDSLIANVKKSFTPKKKRRKKKR